MTSKMHYRESKLNSKEWARWFRAGNGAKFERRVWVCALLCIVMGGGVVFAQSSIFVPNASFESPTVGEPLYAGPVVDDWQKTEQPMGYDTNLYGSWNEKSGVFFNLPSPQPIDNVDGFQGAFLFAYPGVGFLQDFDSVGGTNSVPSHGFDAAFEVGKSYRLTVGLTTSTYPPYKLQEGSTIQLALYYRDGASNRVTIATNNVIFSTNIWTDLFHLLDYSVTVPTVQAGDGWAGQHIGIEVVSTTDLSLATGVWDLDNIRLIGFVQPNLSAPVWIDGQFGFTLNGEAGGTFEVLNTTNASLPIGSWPILKTVTNMTGTLPIIDSSPTPDQRYYSVRQVD